LRSGTVPFPERTLGAFEDPDVIDDEFLGKDGFVYFRPSEVPPNGQVDNQVERLVKGPDFFCALFRGKRVDRLPVDEKFNPVRVPFHSIEVEALLNPF
jgi:hypothetical protein